MSINYCVVVDESVEQREEITRISCVIVDDDEMILEYVASVLSETDQLEIVTFSSSADAIEHLKHHRTHILISDVVMPTIDGIDLLDRAKEIDPLTQVIMISAYSTVGRIVVSLQHGATDFVMKPFTDSEGLLAAVAQTIARWNRWFDVLRKTAVLPEEQE